MSKNYPIKPAKNKLSVKAQNENIINEALASLSVLNEGQRGTRLVTGGMAKTVAKRSLEKTAGETYSLRRHRALAEVAQFANTIQHDKPITASAFNTDLLPIAHPKSTRAHKLNPKNVEQLRARWYADDPRVSNPLVVSLLASAFTANPTSPEYEYAVARLTAMGPREVTLEALVAALKPGANKFFWMQQLRSKKNGRFIKMYGALKKLVRRVNGVFNLAGNMVSANPNTEDIVMELPDGRLVKTNTIEAEGVKALIPSQQGEGGYSKNPVKSAADSDVTNEEDLEFVDSPEGWNKDATWQPTQEDKDYYGENLDLGTMFVDENDNYEVIKFQKANFPAKNRFEMAQQKEAEENDVVAFGKGENEELNPDLPVYFVRRKDGKEKDFAAVQTWADVQALVAADEELYGQDKAPNPKRPVSAGEPVPSELKVGDVVDYKSLPGDMVPGDPDANDARIAAYEKKLAKFNEEGGEFPLDPRRDYFLMDNGTIIDGETGEVLRDSQGSTEPSEDADAPEAEPVAQLPEPTKPTEPTTDAVTVPEGYYEVTRSEYFPEGAIDGQTSPDFTDDPAQLAQEYSAKDLTTALEQAVVGNKENKATGFGQLPFEDGLEVVPAEALYKALDEQGEDADQILDDIYAAGGGDSKAIPDAAPEQQAAFDEAPPLTPEEEKWFNLSRYEITNRYNAQAYLNSDFAAGWFTQFDLFNNAQIMPEFKTFMANERGKKGSLKDKIRKFWRDTVSKLFRNKKWQWDGINYSGAQLYDATPPNFPKGWLYDEVFPRKYFDNWLDSPSEEVLDAIDNGDFPEPAEGAPSEQEIPPLIDGLTEDEKNEFLETGDYKKYLPKNKVYEESDIPEDYAALNNEAWTELEGDLPEDAPEGFSLNPVDIANDYNNEDLIGELRRALEPGNPTPGYGILGMDTPEGEEYVANVPGEAIRDALQLQGVDTDELIDAIYAEGFQGQDGDEPTDEEVQDALEGENVEEGQEPTAESEEEEITPAEEPTPSDEEGPPAPPADSGPATADPEGPVQLTIKAKDLEAGDVTASDFFTVEEVFSDAESEAIKPGSVWIVGYYPGHVTQKTKLWNAETAIKVFRNVTPPTKGDLPELSKPKPKEMDPEGKIYKDKELDIFVPKDAEARSKYLDLLDQYNKDLAQAQKMWTDAPGEAELASWKAVDLTEPFTPDSPVGVTTVKATDVQSGDITFKKEKGNDFYEFFIVESVEEVDGKAVVKGYYPGHISQTKEWNATTEITVMRGATDFPAPGTGPALARPKKGEPDIQQKYIDFNAAKKLSAEGFTPPLDPNTLALTTDAEAAPADKKKTPSKPKSPSYPAFSGERLKQIAAEAGGDPIKFMELLRNEEIVVLDFETAADGTFNKQTPIQVAWTKFKNGKGIATGSYWMNPEVPLGKWYKDKTPEDILKDPSGNPISDEFLAKQPSIAEQMEKLFAQLGPDTIVAAHNMPFDGGILKRYAAQLGIEYKPAGEIDTLILSRLVINGENGEHALEKVAQRYGISPDGDWHDAVTDAEALYPILEALMAEMAKTKQGIQALDVAANDEDYKTKLTEYNVSKGKKDIAETNLVTSKIVKDAFDGKEDLPTVDQAIDSVPKDLPNSEEATTATTAKPTELSDGDNQVESVFGDTISNNWVEDDENTTSLGPVPVEDWKPGDFFRALNGGWYEVLEVVPDPASDKRVFVKRRLLANGQEPEKINPWVKYQAYEIRRRNNDVEETVTPEAAPAPVADEETSFENWQGYDIKQDADGVYYADGISGSDVQKLRNGQLTPPQLPFFAPIGGGNKPDQGDGYFFSANGKRFWGKFGAAGALVRRKNNKGEYEYLLAKRSAGLSQGGGKWGYPGGAHKNKFDAFETLPEAQKEQLLAQPSVAAELRNNFTKNLNALRAEMGLPPLPLESSITPFEELYEEVGPSLSEVAGMVDKGVYVNNVAPDWKYATHLFEVGPDKMKGLSPKDGENSETGWFTSEQISKMANDGDLQVDFAETASTILGLLGDDPDTEDAITPEPGDVAPSVLGTTFDTSKWTKVSGQAGSNQGAFYVDPATGQQYYVKKAKSELHAANEVLASALYEQSGLDVGRSYIGIDKGGNVVIVSPVIEGTQGNLSQFAANQEILDQVKKGFAVDAWMNNYDVIGLDKDNIVVADGKPFRIDAGGALLFRAQGISKAEELDTNVSEQISSLRDPDTNAQAASVFGDMTDAEIAESVKLVEAISESKIDELVDAAFAGDIPNLDSQSMADKLKENLKRRRKELIELYSVQETPEPAPLEKADVEKTPLQVSDSDDQSVPDLETQINEAMASGKNIQFIYNGKSVDLSPEQIKVSKNGNVTVGGTLANGKYYTYSLSKIEQLDGAPSAATAPEAPQAPEAPATPGAPEFTNENIVSPSEIKVGDTIYALGGQKKTVAKTFSTDSGVIFTFDDGEKFSVDDGDLVQKTTPEVEPEAIPELTGEPVEAEKPTEVPQDQKQKLIEKVEKVAEALFGNKDPEQVKKVLQEAKGLFPDEPEVIEAVINDMINPAPVSEPKETAPEKLADDIAQSLTPIDGDEDIPAEEIKTVDIDALADELANPSDPDLIWAKVKEDYSASILDNGHIVVSSSSWGDSVKLDVVVKRNSDNTFSVYHRITKRDGTTLVKQMKGRWHSFTALNSRIQNEIFKSKNTPSKILSAAKKESSSTIVPAAAPKQKEAYVSADGKTVLTVGMEVFWTSPKGVTKKGKVTQLAEQFTVKAKNGKTYIYTDQAKVKFPGEKANWRNSSALTPVNNQTPPPPTSDGDEGGQPGDGGTPVTPPTPTTPAPASPAATPSTQPAAPSGLSETSTISDVEAVAVDKNSAMHTSYFGASSKSEYKDLVKKYLVKDATSSGMNMIPGIVVSNQSPDNADPDLTSYAVVTKTIPDELSVEVSYFDGPLKGTTQKLQQNAVWSKEKFLTNEQSKELGIEVDDSIRAEAIKAQGVKAEEAKKQAIIQAEQEKKQKEEAAQKALIEKAKQELADKFTVDGPGFSVETIDGPADWGSSPLEGVPSLKDALDIVQNGNSVEATNGAQVMVDSGDIEDLKLRIQKVERNVKKQIRVSFKLTDWAGNAFTKLLAKKENLDVIDRARLDQYQVGENGSLVSITEWDANAVDGYDKGRSYRGTLSNGVEFQFVRANRSATTPDFFKKGGSSNGPVSLHNRVELLLPENATPEDIAAALKELGAIQDARPATKADFIGVAENKIISLFGKKGNGAKNYEGELRKQILEEVKKNYDFTAEDMEIRVDEQQKGILQYLLPEKVAEQLASTYGVKYFRHNFNHTNLPSDAKKRADFVYDLLFKTGGGLYSTIIRWSEGINTWGQSSSADLAGVGAGYVFTRKMPSMDLNQGQSKGLDFYFNGVQLIRRPEFYGSTYDGYGIKVEDMDYLDLLKNPNVHEVLFKDNLSWADLSGISLDSPARKILLERLKQEGITDIEGKPLEELFGVKK
jgi:DNA polymerase III epsilon subunit-like protein